MLLANCASSDSILAFIQSARVEFLSSCLMVTRALALENCCRPLVDYGSITEHVCTLPLFPTRQGRCSAFQRRTDSLPNVECLSFRGSRRSNPLFSDHSERYIVFLASKHLNGHRKVEKCKYRPFPKPSRQPWRRDNSSHQERIVVQSVSWLEDIHDQINVADWHKYWINLRSSTRHSQIAQSSQSSCLRASSTRVFLNHYGTR